MFNVNYDEDPGIAALVNNYDFKALSYAIDLTEINDVRFNGLAVRPWTLPL